MFLLEDGGYGDLLPVNGIGYKYALSATFLICSCFCHLLKVGELPDDLKGLLTAI